MPTNISDHLTLPPMLMVRRNFEVPPRLDIDAAMDAEWDRLTPSLGLLTVARVAVGVGSRGIDNSALVTRKVVDKLRQVGAKPFVTPAMDSHGGATAAGQIEVLAERGVTEQSVGAPIEATMETVFLGTSEEGIPLFLDRLAHEADGIVLINRVKPHTNFIGATESGVMKMLAIGLGNQKGAEHYHRLSLVRSQYEIISAAARALLVRSKFLFGVALLENQHHQTCTLKMADKKCIDPNVVGRDCCTYGARRDTPRVTRIFVRDLTGATRGSALGIGQADFTLKRLVDKIDVEATAINCLTSCCPEAGRVPLTYDNDRQALSAALMTIRPSQPDEIGIVYIKNTLDLRRMMVSQAYAEQLERDPDVVVEAVGKSLDLDPEGMLISPFAS